MLLLDSEALSCLAHGPADRQERVRALITDTRRRGRPIATAATILAEVIRGRPADAAVFGTLRRNRVVVSSIDSRAGTRAGQLLGAVGAGSELAVDAFLIATGDLAGGALVATVDPDDLRRLAAHCTAVTVVEI